MDCRTSLKFTFSIPPVSQADPFFHEVEDHDYLENFDYPNNSGNLEN